MDYIDNTCKKTRKPLKTQKSENVESNNDPPNPKNTDFFKRF